MGAMKEHPRYNVVSLRISDEEKITLDAIASRLNLSISDLMREAVGLVQGKLANGELSR